MDRALIAICALLLNAVLGGPARFYEATRLSRLKSYPARLLRDLDRRLNREHRSADEREMRGIVLVVAGVAASLIAGMILGKVFGVLPIAEMALVAFFLPVRPVWDRAFTIRKALAAGDLPRARHALEGTAWRHHALLDEQGLARAAIETTAVHFSERILAPVIVYMLFGLPGIMVCKCLSLMQEVFAPSAADFGNASVKAHAVLQYVPSRVSALMWLVAAAFMLSADLQKVGARIARGAATLPPQALALHSAAAVLNVSLGGGSSVYAGGRRVEYGNARILPADIGRALYGFLLLNLFLFITLGMLF